MNRQVSLTKRVRTARGIRYSPVVYARNGRVRQDVVMVDGKEERHSEGAYYLTWYEASKCIRVSVGTNSTEAESKRLHKQTELNAISQGLIPKAKDQQHGRSLASAVLTYLQETKLTKKPKTLMAYTTALNYFTECCQKRNLEDIERGDMIKFIAFLRDAKDQSPRSCWNKFSNVISFLKTQGVRNVTRRGDWPVFTEEEPEVYEREDIDKLLAKCDEEERLWFEFFLMTGMRDMEVAHTYWRDVNFAASTVRVTHKPELNWTPKQYKEREIPIPTKLVEALKKHKRGARKDCPLVFPTSGCKPKLNFLDELKAVAKRAGLDKEEVWLHKFRATFATWALWAGVDLRTVQMWMGHTDLQSTMRYLKPSRAAETRAKVNAIFG